MKRAWLTGRRDPFPTTYNEPAESGTASYRLASELGTDARFTAAIYAQWEPSGRGGRETVFPYLGTHGAEATRKFSVLDVAEANDALTRTLSRMAGNEIPGTGIRPLPLTSGTYGCLCPFSGGVLRACHDRVRRCGAAVRTARLLL